MAYKHGNVINQIAVRWTNMWKIVAAVRQPKYMRNLIDAQVFVEKNRVLLKSSIIPEKVFE